MPRNFLLLSLTTIIALSGCRHSFTEILLKDDFFRLDTGLFSVPVGAHTEYHFLPEATPKGNWAVSSFASGDAWGRAWQIKKEGTGHVLCQTFLRF